MMIQCPACTQPVTPQDAACPACGIPLHHETILDSGRPTGQHEGVRFQWPTQGDRPAERAPDPNSDCWNLTRSLPD
ncbi:MAG: hypothetical protein EXS05_21000 [Planctomycetaceae bacterium]|nr:hypothetical protein [Planctomycetaceae bacterium]